MIAINDLFVNVWDKQILNGLTLSFDLGKNYVILGKNGSGKSTLSSVLAGNPKYEVISGSIILDSENLVEMTPEQRSAEGIFLSFQNVPEIKGIKLIEYLRTVYNIHLLKKPASWETGLGSTGLSPFLFKRFIKKYTEELRIDESFLDRDLNVGFSGGEKRKIEILQMKLIWPKYIILDEIDSGLDVDAFRTVAEFLKSIDTPENSIIIITHYFTILDYIDVDTVYVVQDGKVVKTWWKEIVENVQEKWFGS
jgi:Fe-S cluster assembly ATP-binding protein